jgi:preflagellin peptidase FlaK
MIDAGPDLVRLITVPAFAWAAWSDYHTRRVDPRLWPVLILIGITASIWHTIQIAPLRTAGDFNILLQIAMVPPIAGAIASSLYSLGHLGGADVKAIFTISLLFPAGIQYPVPLIGATFPVFESPFQITGLSIMVNSMIVAIFYPLHMWYENLRRGHLSASMVASKIVPVSKLESTSGQVKIKSKTDQRQHIIDLDTLRMYLRWRGISVQNLRTEKGSLSDPQTISETYEVDSGAISSKQGAGRFITTDHFKTGRGKQTNLDISSTPETDPWGANQFLESINHGAYGATAEELRHCLNHITKNDTVQILPAFPLIVPIFVGLLLTLTIGDLAAAWVFGILHPH